MQVPAGGMNEINGDIPKFRGTDSSTVGNQEKIGRQNRDAWSTYTQDLLGIIMRLETWRCYWFLLWYLANQRFQIMCRGMWTNANHLSLDFDYDPLLFFQRVLLSHEAEKKIRINGSVSATEELCCWLKLAILLSPSHWPCYWVWNGKEWAVCHKTKISFSCIDPLIPCTWDQWFHILTDSRPTLLQADQQRAIHTASFRAHL